MAFTQNQSIVAEYYIAALGRVPEVSGLDYWVGRLEGTISGETQLTEEEITEQFFNREIAEVASRFPENQTTEEFVTSVYANVFGREADEGGLIYWSGRLTGENDSGQAALTQNNLLKEMLLIAKNTGNEIDGEYLQSKLEEAQTNYDASNDIISPTIASIEIADGNYTPHSIVDITLTFDEDVIVQNSDSQVAIMIGEYTKYAEYAYKTSDSITYKYVVEDGISSEEQTIQVTQNALVLNDTTIYDSSNNSAVLTNAIVENTNAIVNDNKAPSIKITSAYYTSNTDKLILNGSGFFTMLEQNEDSSAEVIDRFDFTKFIWDIDGDYDTINATDTDPSIANALFTNTDIRLIKIESDSEISVVFSNDSAAFEELENFGHLGGTQVDTLDILSGFVLDKVGNISTNAISNNITLGIDTLFYGNDENNIITGTSNNDKIYAVDGSNILYGKYGNDTIVGADSNDTIIGGLGKDTLTGGLGADKFVFSTLNNDSVIAFGTLEGIDKITDLSLDGNISDRIDLDVTVDTINDAVTGTVNQNTFIYDINSLVSVSNAGFDILEKNDISATVVHVDGGSQNTKSYMLIDLDADDSFTQNDFAIEITGVTIENFDLNIFI